MKVGIYVKCRSKGNPRGAGAAAAVIEYIDRSGKNHTRAQWIQAEYETKNALYLKICIAAMRILLKPCDVTIYMECDYIGNIFRLGWMEKWQREGWKKANGKEPANAEEWKQLYMLAKIHAVRFEGYNDRYDKEMERILGGWEKEKIS